MRFRSLFTWRAAEVTAVIVWFVLTALTLVGWLLPVSSYDKLQGIAGNLLTELLGIGLTALLVGFLFGGRERAEAKRRNEIAIRQLKRPLQRHVTLLFNIYKAASTQKPLREIKEVEDLLTEDFYVNAAFLDLARKAPTYMAPIGEVHWFRYLANECKGLQKELNGVIAKYGSVLDSNTIDAVESLLASPLLNTALDFETMPEMDEKLGRKRDYNFFAHLSDVLKKHNDAFVKLIRLYNSTAVDQHIDLSDETWSDNFSPRVGSGRLDRNARGE